MDPTPIDSASMIGHACISAIGCLRGKKGEINGCLVLVGSNAGLQLHLRTSLRKSGQDSFQPFLSSPSSGSPQGLPVIIPRLTASYLRSDRQVHGLLCADLLTSFQGFRVSPLVIYTQYDVHDGSLCLCSD
jgi:hypothetical protein